MSQKVEDLLKEGIALRLNGKPVRIRTESSRIVLHPGAGDLPTIKIVAEYVGKFGEKISRIETMSPSETITTRTEPNGKR